MKKKIKFKKNRFKRNKLLINHVIFKILLKINLKKEKKK